MIEPLESRIAPAAVFTLTDVDGDLVTVKTSKGTNADLAAVISMGMPSDGVTGSMTINKIDLAANPVFDGTNLSVSAKPGPLGGDGLVNVASIAAAGLDLGIVKVSGDLRDLDAGKNSVASTIKTIDVQSTSGATIWEIKGNLGKLKVAHDLRGAEIDMLVPGTTLGSLQVGGSIIGETTTKTGFVNVPNGVIGKVNIKGSILGGSGNTQCGAIAAKEILAVSIGGSIYGGSGDDSGKISATGKLGPVTIKGDLRGSAGFNSGQVKTDGTLASLTIRGSLIGGSNFFSGRIGAGGAAGPIKIGRDLIGGSGDSSGSINCGGGIAAFTLGGDLLGGANQATGVVGSGGDIGSVKVGGSILAGSIAVSTGISSSGKMGKVTIGGDVIAGPSSTGFINAGQEIGAIKIGGSLLGNSGSSARISAGNPTSGQLAIKSITIGGRVEYGFIYLPGADSQVGAVKVGGDWIASTIATGIDSTFGRYGTTDDVVTAMGPNDPLLFSKIASIAIGGQVLGTVGGTDHFGFVSQEIGTLKIHGVKVPLAAGRGNDTDVNNTHFILGTTRDVTVHEVA